MNDRYGPDEHKAVIECVHQLGLKFQLVHHTPIRAADFVQPQMDMSFDKEKLGPGGMKYRVAFDRMMVSGTMSMSGVVGMPVTMNAVAASAQVAVSMPAMMALEHQTVIKMWLGMAVAKSGVVSFQVIVLVSMVVIVVLMRGLVMVVKSRSCPDQLLFHDCQSRTERSIFFQQFIEGGGYGPRIGSHQKQCDASDK